MTSDALQLTKFAGLIRSGIPIEKALEHIGGMPTKSSGFKYLLEVSLDAGAAVANEVDLVADLFSFKERATERIFIAHATPKASARLVMWLPIITLGLAQLIGLDIYASLQTRPALLLSLGFGLALLLIAKTLSSRLIRRATPEEITLGFYLMGVALESSGGASINQAQNRASTIYLREFGCSPPDSELKAMAQVETLVQETGARVGDLLRREAEQLQRECLVASELKIEKLGVKLMLPLGLAVLPAFVFLAVVPLMFSMLGPK